MAPTLNYEIPMRPTYQKERDEKNKEEAIDQVCLYLKGDELERLGMFSAADYMIYKKNKITHIVQLKTRNNCSFDYPTYMISHNKWKNFIALAELNECKAVLVVRWADKIGILIDREPDFVQHGGRYDRNDPYDMESMAHFYVKNFTMTDH